jgi:citrate lyase subunit beta / citryl-CoA lyase
VSGIELSGPAPQAPELPGPALLFCPAHRHDRYAKALAAADMAILDLEDATPADQKDAARAHVVTALAEHDPARIIVRINPTATDAGRRDVEALAGTSCRTVMVAKAEDPDALAEVAAAGGFALIAIAETARGARRLDALAAAPGVAGLMWGSEDLTADLGGRSSRDDAGAHLPHVTHLRGGLLLAAAAAGAYAVDGVWLDLEDLDGLAREAREAALMGYRAKAAVHPAQVPVIRAAFAPTDEELARARRVLEAAEGADGGAHRTDGRMIDEPLLRQARAIIAAARNG